MSLQLRVLNILALVSLVLFFLGVLLFHIFSPCNARAFPHLNPQLVCDNKPVVAKYGYAGLKNDLEEYIEAKKELGEVTEVSIYFRDLQYGPTMDVDAYDQFSPASLLKLPLLLTYLGLLEQHPDLLATVLTPQPVDDPLNPAIIPDHTVQPYAPYTVEELLTSMIEHSDNLAYYTLARYLLELSPEKDLTEQTLVDLGIVSPKSAIDEVISVRAYASIFVQLYHSSFLPTKDLSEKALHYLSTSAFDDGIAAGVPAEVEVAKKFGERFGFDENTVQLHDCGIVYYPKNPYVLCVMTRGLDMEALPAVIADISRMVYQEFDSRKY